jgi:hypothetical protein
MTTIAWVGENYWLAEMVRDRFNVEVMRMVDATQAQPELRDTSYPIIVLTEGAPAGLGAQFPEELDPCEGPDVARFLLREARKGPANHSAYILMLCRRHHEITPKRLVYDHTGTYMREGASEAILQEDYDASGLVHRVGEILGVQ